MIINKGSLHEAVERSVRETIENMAFAEILPCGEEAYRAGGGEMIWASVVIKRPVAGEMTVCMPVALLQEIAGDVYGEAEGSADPKNQGELTERREQLLADTIGELVNTTVGLVLRTLIPEDQEFAVGLPVSERGEPDVSDSDRMYFTCNEHCFMVAVDSEVLA
jgi:hypothetical protein